MEQYADDSDGFEQVVHDGGEPRLVRLVLGEHPRGCHVNVLVGGGNHPEYFRKRDGELEIVKILLHDGGKLLDGIHKIVVLHGGRSELTGHGVAEVLLHHGNASVDEIAEVVGEIGIDAPDHDFVAEITVAAKGHFSQNVVSHSVNAVAVA